MKVKSLALFTLLVFTGCADKEYIPGTFTTMTDNVRIYSKTQIVSVAAPENRGVPFIGFFHNDKDFLSLKRGLRGEMVEQVIINF